MVPISIRVITRRDGPRMISACARNGVETQWDRTPRLVKPNHSPITAPTLRSWTFEITVTSQLKRVLCKMSQNWLLPSKNESIEIFSTRNPKIYKICLSEFSANSVVQPIRIMVDFHTLRNSAVNQWLTTRKYISD